MKKMFALATMAMFATGLAMADLTGNGSGNSGNPGDPFVFGYSGFAPGTSVVDLTVTDNLGNVYIFSTDYAEINAGALNQGWWSISETNDNSNYNYIVGTNVFSPGDTYNDFFTFNLGQNVITGTSIVSATLSIPTDTGYCSPEPSCEITTPYPVTYQVGSVSIDAGTLNDKNNGPDAGIVAALGSGTVYGDYTFNSLADYTNPVNITLDGTALSALNGVYDTSAYFSIGGTLSPTVVPEPSSLALLGTLAVGLLFQLRRKVRLWYQPLKHV
jgi:hypothetical protein